MQKIASRKFLAGFAATALLLLALVGGFNVLIDPYSVWNCYRGVGINKWAPKADDLDRLIKPIEILNKKPAALFLGDSQVLWGIDPAAYAQMTGKSAYNYGLRGASVYELRRSLEHVIAVDEGLRDVYLNIDFNMFAYSPYLSNDKTKAGFDEEQLGKKHISLTNIEKTVFSWQALKDSWETLSANRKGRYEESFYTPEGHPHNSSILYYYRDKPNSFYTSFANDARSGRYEGELLLDDEAFAELELIKQLCQRNGINLHLMSLPMHAIALELFDFSGKAYADYLHRVVEIAPLLDFNGYNQYSQSPLQKMPWEPDRNAYFWDAHHPKDILGNTVQQVLLSGSGEIGQMVTRENADEHLRALAAGRKAWDAAHPESIEEVRYYMGFYPQAPLAMRDSAASAGKSVVKLDLNSGAEIPQLRMPAQGMLDLTGVRFSPADDFKALYAMLENAEGQRYYAFAETAPSPGIVTFMHSSKYDRSGFRIYEPLRQVPKRTWDLYLLEVTAAGKAYQSDLLARIIVE